MRPSTSVRRVRWASLSSAAALTCATTSPRRATATSAKNCTASSAGCPRSSSTVWVSSAAAIGLTLPLALSSTLRSNPTRPSAGTRVVAQQDGKSRLRVEDAGEPEQLVFDLVDLVLAFGDFQQRLPRQRARWHRSDRSWPTNAPRRPLGARRARLRRPCRIPAARSTGPWAPRPRRAR